MSTHRYYHKATKENNHERMDFDKKLQEMAI